MIHDPDDPEDFGPEEDEIDVENPVEREPVEDDAPPPEEKATKPLDTTPKPKRAFSRPPGQCWPLSKGARAQIAELLVDGEDVEALAKRFGAKVEDVKDCAFDALDITRERIRALIPSHRRGHSPTTFSPEYAGPSVPLTEPERIHKFILFGWTPRKIANKMKLSREYVDQVLADARTELKAEQSETTRTVIQHVLDHVADEALEHGIGGTMNALKNRQVVVEAAKAMAKLTGANAPKPGDLREDGAGARTTT